MKREIERIKENLRKQRGSEILKVILIAGILLVLIITLFYPQMEKLFSNMMQTITEWFESTGSEIFRT